MFAHAALQEDHAHRDAFLAAPKDGSEWAMHLARLVDSTYLKQDCTEAHIQNICADATAFAFRSVCVPPNRVSLASKLLQALKKTMPVETCTVVGFPNGYNETSIKCTEVRHALAQGATEIDFVQNVGWVKESRWDLLEQEYKALVQSAEGRLVKVILETSLLTSNEIRECTLRAARSGVHVIKTSTGFCGRGASLEDIETMAQALREVTEETGLLYGIKASGGVRSSEDAMRFVQAGATRLGTSGGVSLVKGLQNTQGY